MKRQRSITRNLVVTVLLLELLSAAALIGTITIHERRVQLKSFDATLMGTAQSLMAAVQESEDESDDVTLDQRGLRLSRFAIFHVQDEHGRVLGSAGPAPRLEEAPSDEPVFENADAANRRYRFITLHGLRVIDPGLPGGGVRHKVTVVYGMPVGRVWHEVFEAVRFAAIATLLLLGMTATVMVLILRKELSPIRELALEAGQITSNNWRFKAPESARSTVELRPLVFALEDALTRLEASFRQQRRFTSDAAHELKTDLAIVKSSLQLLSMRQRSVEEYERGLAIGLEDFTRLEMTVQKMLTLSRLEQPVVEAVAGSARCSLTSVIEDAVQQSLPFAELKMAKLDVCSTGEAYVAIDRHDALLLCSNILSNALQHSPEGATVWVRLERDDARVQLTVRDEGSGILEKDRPYLFEPFYRGDPSRSRKSGSTGLGLAICKAICQRTGGSIDISNEPRGGALVKVTLPIVAPPTLEHEHSASLKA